MSNEERDDLVFFSVTEEQKLILRELQEQLFETEAGAFKACVSLALSKGSEPADFSKGKTTWNATTMNDLVEFLTWYCKTNTPIRVANGLGYAGIQFVESEMANGKTPREIFNL
jgi:hypothetical protein